MRFFVVTIFPDFFSGFVSNGLISRAVENSLIEVIPISPRQFTTDKHHTVDDTLYGGGCGLLLKAKPLIDAVEYIISTYQCHNFHIIHLKPSETVYTQKIATQLTTYEDVIIICGRYEGVDHRFELYMRDHYPDRYMNLSLGQFILLGGESASMIVIESVARLLPGVIKEEESHQRESYSLDNEMKNIEHPHYTKPYEVYGYTVPDILLSGHHKNIENRRRDNTHFISDPENEH